LIEFEIPKHMVLFIRLALFAPPAPTGHDAHT
jgi:hypothetical protein